MIKTTQNNCTPERAAFLKTQKELRRLELHAQLSEMGLQVSKIPSQRIAEVWSNIELIRQAQANGAAKTRDIQQETQNELNALHQKGNDIIKNLQSLYGLKKEPTHEPGGEE